MTADAHGPVLQCDHLWRRHTDSIIPVRDVSITVDRGEFVAITGPSGSGKTSLLALLGLLDTPSAGTYRILGRNIVDATEAQRAAIRSRLIGFVFQSFNLLPARTALENVAVGMLYSGMSRNQRRHQAWTTLGELGLAHRLHALVNTLSGGEQQRVAVARALASHPHVLFCDEPTGNLDSENTHRLLRTLQDLNQQGLTVVIATHDHTVAEVASTRYHMIDGMLTRTGHSLAR